MTGYAAQPHAGRPAGKKALRGGHLLANPDGIFCPFSSRRFQFPSVRSRAFRRSVLSFLAACDMLKARKDTKEVSAA